MALFQDSRTLQGQKVSVMPGAEKINPIFNRENLGAAIKTAGTVGKYFIPGGPLVGIVAGKATDIATDAAANAVSPNESVGQSTPQMDKLDPMTGLPWTESTAPGGYKKHLKWLKENPDMLETDEQRKMLDDALAGRTYKDTANEVLSAADDVDVDELVGGAESLSDVGDTTENIGDIASAGDTVKKGAKLKSALGKTGKVLGAAGMAAGIASDVLQVGGAWSAAADKRKKRYMKRREDKTSDLGAFSYT